jgi:rare lipoprotein A (peptidoglycan hydrolase)
MIRDTPAARIVRALCGVLFLAAAGAFVTAEQMPDEIDSFDFVLPEPIVPDGSSAPAEAEAQVRAPDNAQLLLPEPALPGSSPAPAAHELEGFASWYGGRFQGQLTANGEVFDTNLLTAAHRTLPFNTIVEVTHLENSQTVEVRINDRGPFVEGRVIDLSRAAADAIGMAGEGVARVSLRIVSEPAEPVRSIQVASFTAEDGARTIVRRLAEREIDAIVERRR